MFDLAELERAHEIVGQAVPPTPAHAWPLLGGAAGHARRGQAREPHADRRLQGARRPGLSRSAEAGAAEHARASFPPPAAITARALPLPPAVKAFRAVIYVPSAAIPSRRTARCARSAPSWSSMARTFRRQPKRPRAAPSSPVCTWCRRSIPTSCSASRPMRWNCCRAAPDLDVLYVPIGQGSGICGCIMARDLLGPENRNRRRAVDRKRRPCALSFAAGHGRDDRDQQHAGRRHGDPRSRCRSALAMIRKGASRIVQVTDDEVAAAVRAYWTDTHNLAEGAAQPRSPRRCRKRQNSPASAWASILSGRQYRFRSVPANGSGRTARRRHCAMA